MIFASLFYTCVLLNTVLSDSGSSGCGGYGVLTTSTGYIKSHTLHGTSSYLHNKDCSWLIKAPALNRIRLEFTGGIDLEESNDCNYDYISVYDGSTTNAPLIGTWCGKGTIPSLLSKSNNLLVEFVTDAEVSSKGFKLKYEFFRSATYTGCYTDEFKCSNERCISEEWRCDSYDDCDDNSDERNCTSTTKCKTGEYMCSDGECISSQWACDGQIDCRDKSDEASCKTCTASQFLCDNKQSCIDKDFVCDGESDCPDGSDEARCQSCKQRTEFQCGNRKCIPVGYVCDGDNDCDDNTDEVSCTKTTTGRPITSTAKAADNSSSCGGIIRLSGTGGSFTTPNYPSPYPNSQKCQWEIQARIGQKVALSFDDFELETGGLITGGSRGCQYDHVSIYDDKISIQTLVGRYCGTNKPAPIFSSNSLMVVQFISNSFISKKGFKATWRVVNENVEDDSSGCVGPRDQISDKGSIISHNQFGRTAYNKSECVWVIPSKGGAIVDLTFNGFNLEESDNCQYDSVTIHRGTTEQSPIAGVFCGARIPKDLSSDYGFYIVFKADANANGYGFNITYSKRPSITSLLLTSTMNPITTTRAIIQTTTTASPLKNCKVTQIINSSPGVIQSLDYGIRSQYAPGLNCSWLIIAPKGQLINLVFEDFALEYHRSCGYDDVSIYDGTSSKSALLQRSCGTKIPPDVKSSSTAMYIEFITDQATGYKGFKASFQFQPEPVTCKSGEFSCSNGQCISEKLQCNAANDCGDNSDEHLCYPGFETCGVQSSKYPIRVGTTKIVGGTEVNQFSWPWQAHVSYSSSFTCGGSLIHPQWIVTAAHCLEDRETRASRWTVKLGKHKDSYESAEVRVSVSQIIEYPHYDQTTTDSDIALFKLSSPVQFSDRVKPICLPGTTLLPQNTVCYVTGWGETEGTGSEGLLKQATMPTISRATCNKPTWYNGEVTKHMFCAGYSSGGQDSCEGDSGGPLSCRKDGRFILEGVVSWGNGCAVPNAPGIYTGVPYFVKWIRETIANN